jgi:WD40 repeat protein
LSPDGKLIFGTNGKEVLAYDALTLGEEYVLGKNIQNRNVAMYTLDNMANWMAVSYFNHGLRVFEITSEKEICFIDTGFSGTGFGCLAFTPDGKVLAAARRDTIFFFGTEKWERNRVIKPAGSYENFFSMEFTGDGRIMACGDENGNVCLLAPGTGREISRFKAHEAPVNQMRFGPGGTLLATSSNDRTFKIWDVKDEIQNPKSEIRNPKFKNAHLHFSGIHPASTIFVL